MHLESTSLIVSLDEPCLVLEELHLQSLGSRGFHRYQLLKVIRGDKTAVYQEDMGPIALFTGVPQIRLIGAWRDDEGHIHIEHTVGQLREQAEEIRNEHKPPPFDFLGKRLVEGYAQVVERAPKERRRVSEFGPLYMKRRN